LNSPASTRLGVARQRWLALALLVAIAFAFQGSRGLYEPDEGRYSDVALQMLASGDLLVPHLDPEHPHYTKPPLTYWSIAAGVALLGRNEWGVRLPAALAFICTGLIAFGIARRLGSAQPLRATAVYATMVLPVVGANLATTDPLLTAFEALAVYGVVRLETGAVAAGRWLAWLGFGLAFATKGPPGLLPLLGVFAYLVHAHGLRGAGRLFAVGPLLLFAALAGAWFAWIVARDPAMLRYFLVFETLDRVASDVHHRNPGWLGLLKAYGPVVIVGAAPWLPIAAWQWARARRAGPTVAATATADSHASPEPAASLDRLLLAWLLVPFAVFCLAQSRLPLYLLPLSVPLALLIARRLDRAGPWSRRAWTATLAWAVALIALKAVGAHVHAPQDSRAFASELAAAADVSRYTELVFVDAPARYGLALYLGLDVEAGALQSQPRRVVGIEPRHGVCDELAEHDRPLFVVRRLERTAFDGVFARCGHEAPRLVGRVRDWELLERRSNDGLADVPRPVTSSAR
jgi:4-amino-4-deoxy-L-arabinose transferase